jgi:Zn-dependent peptidase ImmA (M78 family)
MNELILFLAVVFAASVFMPKTVMARLFSNRQEKADVSSSVEVKQGMVIPEDSMLRRHFLTHLRSTVEVELMSQPIDPTLRHYYDASVAAEIQKRLTSSVSA